MVVHWKKNKGPGLVRNMVVNGIGAVATGITLSVVLIAKFVEGAWITVVLIPALIFLMYSVHRHYKRVERATASDSAVNTKDLCEPMVEHDE